MQLSIEQTMLATIIAGLLAPFIVQLLKGPLAAAGDKALYLAFGVALILGAIIALVTGIPAPLPGPDPIAFLEKAAVFGAVVVAIATFIYQKWLSELEPGKAFANPVV